MEQQAQGDGRGREFFFFSFFPPSILLPLEQQKRLQTRQEEVNVEQIEAGQGHGREPVFSARLRDRVKEPRDIRSEVPPGEAPARRRRRGSKLPASQAARKWQQQQQQKRPRPTAAAATAALPRPGTRARTRAPPGRGTRRARAWPRQPLQRVSARRSWQRRRRRPCREQAPCTFAEQPLRAPLPPPPPAPAGGAL